LAADLTSDVDKLGLGTAQFGFDYGVTNSIGKVPELQVREILGYARDNKIRILDTAAAYGDSEAVVGNVAGDWVNFAIVTKTIPVETNDIGAAELKVIAEGFRSSLRRLRARSVYGLLVHHGGLLLHRGGDRLCELLALWRRQGLVRKIGASVYEGEQALRLSERFPLDLVQLPLSVLDQRALTDGWLQALNERGIEVHARSVFLQGLLLREAPLPGRLMRFARVLQQFHDYVAAAGYTPLEAALGFVTRQPHVRAALVGVTSVEQLRECTAASLRGCPLDLQRFACTDGELIDPRRWSAS